MQFKATAPGSLMLLGEYAVLQGKPALVCAINKHITVTLTPRLDDEIHLSSSLYGEYKTTLADLKIEKPYQFILGTLKHFQPKMRWGCDLEITTDFSDKIGFGSSSAVTVATMATLVTWIDIKMTQHDMLRQARIIIRSVQNGVGSGADVAAAIYGGMVAYQAQPLGAEKIQAIHPLSVLYSGFKTPTPEAILKVQQRFANYPELFKQLCHTIGQCAWQGIQYARKQDWGALGEVMNIQQGLLEALGVSLPVLTDMVHDLRNQSGVRGAKISGAGLGDCVVALGNLPNDYHFHSNTANVECVPVAMTLQGVQCDKY